MINFNMIGDRTIDILNTKELCLGVISVELLRTTITTLQLSVPLKQLINCSVNDVFALTESLLLF